MAGEESTVVLGVDGASPVRSPGGARRAVRCAPWLVE